MVVMVFARRVLLVVVETDGRRSRRAPNLGRARSADRLEGAGRIRAQAHGRGRHRALRSRQGDQRTTVIRTPGRIFGPKDSCGGTSGFGSVRTRADHRVPSTSSSHDAVRAGTSPASDEGLRHEAAARRRTSSRVPVPPADSGGRRRRSRRGRRPRPSSSSRTGVFTCRSSATDPTLVGVAGPRRSRSPKISTAGSELRPGDGDQLLAVPATGAGRRPQRADQHRVFFE